MSEVNAFKSDERGGNLDVQPSVGVGNVDLISVSEILEVQVSVGHRYAYWSSTEVSPMESRSGDIGYLELPL